jgi:quercetin dioxygenase-like cupin family protein
VLLALYEHPHGVETPAGNRVVYDIEHGEAHFGAASVAGRALRWELAEADEKHPPPLHSAAVDLDPSAAWVMRCDRVDFPPGGVAYRHTHPGPGVRYLLHGSIRIESAGVEIAYHQGEAWFEEAGYPVLATASADEETAFVRVLLLPREWAGKRTIRYLDAADDDRPKLQRATILLEQPIEP